MVKVSNLFTDAGVDLSTARSTVINWPNQVLAIVDGYRGFKGIPHGVQKDAIQNSWDARKDKKKSKGWGLRFEVTRSKRGDVFLSITDKGTTGLTGRVLKPEELQDDLPMEEKWGRFENVAFTKDPSEGALGSRGRGKFIFVGASKINTIFYDTFREDGIYRFGYRTITQTESPVDAKDNDEGKNLLAKLTDNTLSPLTEVGTRVIIVNPIDELLEDIDSGQFVNAINETWWEVLQKFEIDIQVVSEGKVWKAHVPDQFELPENDNKDFKVWIKEGDKVRVGKTDYRIKRLHIVRNMKRSVSEELRGVSIQRGGMKVSSISIRYVTADIADSVYGYITLEKDYEDAVLPHENPEHYEFDFRKPSPKALKNYIEGELNRFAQEKLGVGVDPTTIKHERQRNAELRALNAVNKIVKRLGLFGKGPGGGGKPRPPHPPPPSKLLYIELPMPILPRESRRINYGEKVENVKLIVHNDTKEDVKVKVMLTLQFEGEEFKKFVERDLTISAMSNQELGSFYYEFKKGDPQGKYAIQGTIISMMPANKGKTLDRVAINIWVETDPPEKGIFDQVKPLEYPEEIKDLLGDSYKSETGGYTFTYNVKHPAYEVVNESEDALADYLVNVMAYEVPRIDLRNETPQLFKLEDMNNPDRIMRIVSETVGHILYEYHYLS